MYPCEVQFKGCVYNSSEQAYQHQWALATKPSLAAKILQADGMKSKSKQLPRAQRIQWNERFTIGIMKELLKAKDEQVSKFKEVLVESEGRYLLEATHHPFWGACCKATHDPFWGTC